MALVRDLCVSLAKQFRAVALVNVNQEPANLEALKKACEEAKKAGASVCFTDFRRSAGPTAWARRSRGRPRRQLETSLMLAAAPRPVREKERISLPPMDALGPGAQKGAKVVRRGRRRGRLLRRPHRRQRRGGRGALHAPSPTSSRSSIMEHLGSKA